MKKRRLYQQWVEQAGLPPEAIPEEEAAGDIIPKIKKEKLHPNITYILLGAIIVLLCAVIIILIIQTC